MLLASSDSNPLAERSQTANDRRYCRTMPSRDSDEVGDGQSDLQHDEVDEPVDVDPDTPLATHAGVAGPWRVSDGTPVPFAEAKRVWAEVAYNVLVTTATKYNHYVTYSELAHQVLKESGINYRPHQRNWIGKVLGLVARRCVEAGEPPLTALCVSTGDECVGVGYEYVLKLTGESVPDDLQPHAAEARLQCYRFYGAELPRGGGEPTLTRRVAERRARVSRPEPPPARLCPVHRIQLPATGICDDCS